MWVNGTSFQKLDPASGQHAAKLFIVVWERVLIPNLARNVQDYSAHKTGPVATNIEVTYLGLRLTFGMNVTGGCSPNNTLRSNCIHMVIWSHPLTGSNIWSGKALDVMTSRHENEYPIAGHFWGESITMASPHKDSMMRNFNIFLCYNAKYSVEQTVEELVVWDSMMPMRHFNYLRLKLVSFLATPLVLLLQCFGLNVLFSWCVSEFLKAVIS